MRSVKTNEHVLEIESYFFKFGHEVLTYVTEIRIVFFKCFPEDNNRIHGYLFLPDFWGKCNVHPLFGY